MKSMRNNKSTVKCTFSPFFAYLSPCLFFHRKNKNKIESELNSCANIYSIHHIGMNRKIAQLFLINETAFQSESEQMTIETESKLKCSIKPKFKAFKYISVNILILFKLKV